MRARRSRALPAAFLTAISVAAVLGPSATAHAQAASGAPPVVWVLATGGTISGGGQSSTSLTQYRSGAFSGEQLVSAVPAIAEHATVRVEQIVNIGSPNITFDDWLTLARGIDEIFSGDPDAAGVVVTHGTNTLEETAYFLNLTVRHDRPVVLAGTQRPATAISTDGPLNSRPAGWNRRTQKRAEGERSPRQEWSSTDGMIDDEGTHRARRPLERPHRCPALSPRPSATSIAAWRTSKDESRVSTRRTIDAVGPWPWTHGPPPVGNREPPTPLRWPADRSSTTASPGASM